jgi:hypothetical protein
MTVSIDIFIYCSTFTLDELFKIKYGSVPEFYKTREIGDIVGFSIYGEEVRRDESAR